MRKLLIVAAAAGVIATTVAEAQIVRRVIGHAVASQAVRSILGKDKDAAGQDAGAAGPGAEATEGARDGAPASDSGPAQDRPVR